MSFEEVNTPSAEYTQAILDSTVEGIWTIGLDGLIKTVNKSAMKMFGYDNAEQMIGRNSHNLVHYKKSDGRPYPVEGCPIYGAFQMGVPVHLEDEVLWREDGTSFYANYRSVPLWKEGKIIGAVVTFLDSSQQVLARHNLAENQMDLVDTLESMSDAFCSVDKNWIIQRLNKNMEKITGLTRRELLRKNFREAFPPTADLRDDQHWLPYQKAMLKRKAVIFEIFYEPLQIWTQVRVYPKSDGGLAVFYTDVTQRKNAEIALRESEINFKAIAEATPQMVWTATPEGLVDYANSQWYNFTGLSPEQTMGLGFTTIIHPEDRPLSLALYAEALQKKKLLKVEHRFKSGVDGMYRWFLVRAQPTFDASGKVTKWFGTITDIQDQKQAAEELAFAKSEAEKANQTKSAFLANMSHEIRTPLGAIIGFTELLREGLIEPEERENFLDTISRNGRALTRIIDDILDLAKVESGKLEVESIEFSFLEMVEEVMELFSESLKIKGIYLRLEMADWVPAQISSDPTRLRQILINIIGNAVKFTERGGVLVQIRTSPGAASQLQFIIEVKDTGMGLSLEQQNRLFQPFMQADNTTTRKFGGTGLGLALSKRLANALGGDIRIVKSHPGEGCTFEISFLTCALKHLGEDLRFALNTVDKIENGKRLLLSGVKVLLAEDSHDNQYLICRILRKHGASVDVASNGAEAFRLGLKDPYDIVLMDLQMPVMDGFEATKSLREAGFKKPIIALTAHAMAEERARTRAAGCDAHLTKPLSPLELIETIGKHISEQQEFLF